MAYIRRIQRPAAAGRAGLRRPGRSHGPGFELPPYMRDFAENRLVEAPQAFATFIGMARRTNDMVHGSTDPATSARSRAPTAARVPMPRLSTVQTWLDGLSNGGKMMPVRGVGDPADDRPDFGVNAV